MAAKKEEALYIRNRRPNRIIVNWAGTRYPPLERRGSRQDSLSLPAEAENDPVIARWLRVGILEKISKEAFMKLGSRTVDIEPNQFLKRPVRTNGFKDLLLEKVTEGNTSGEKFNINETAARKASTPNLEWAGELMSTDEEIEGMDFNHNTANYPSHHREQE
jgi:hypothetical protein